MTAHMVEARNQLHRGNAMFADTSQLLLIVSDGRCLGDRRKVKAAVRRTQDAQIFLVFIVLANPDKEVRLYFSAANFHFQYFCSYSARPSSRHHLSSGDCLEDRFVAITALSLLSDTWAYFKTSTVVLCYEFYQRDSYRLDTVYI